MLNLLTYKIIFLTFLHILKLESCSYSNGTSYHFVLEVPRPPPSPELWINHFSSFPCCILHIFSGVIGQYQRVVSAILSRQSTQILTILVPIHVIALLSMDQPCMKVKFFWVFFVINAQNKTMCMYKPLWLPKNMIGTF